MLRHLQNFFKSVGTFLKINKDILWIIYVTKKADTLFVFSFFNLIFSSVYSILQLSEWINQFFEYTRDKAMIICNNFGRPLHLLIELNRFTEITNHTFR